MHANAGASELYLDKSGVSGPGHTNTCPDWDNFLMQCPETADPLNIKISLSKRDVITTNK